MKVLLLSLAVLCSIAWAQARLGNGFPRGFPPGSTGPTFPRPPVSHRFRREPQGSIVLEGRQPLDGPDRHGTLDLNYKHQIIDNDRTSLDAFGGANLHRGRVSSQIGAEIEHRFKNDMFIRGKAQMEQHQGPTFGIEAGGRFRREALPYEEEEVFEDVY